MEFRQLRCFIAVAESLSFTEAARTLHITQSVVSHHVAELETELGAKLFVRDSQSVHLTAIGSIFQKDAYRLLLLRDEAARRARDCASGVVGRLSIGLPAAPVINCVSSPIAEFHLEHPDVLLEMHEKFPGELSKSIVDGDIDIGFTRSISVQNIPELKWKVIFTDHMSVVVPANHPVADNDKVQLSAIDGEPLILINRSTGPGLFDLGMKLFLDRGLSPNIISQPNHINTIQMMVRVGLGLSILPDCYNYAGDTGIRFINIEGNDALAHVVVAWCTHNKNPSIPLFLRKMGVDV